MPTALELPTDRPRPPGASLRGAWRRKTMPAELVDSLHALARANGATLFMTLLAAYEVLLYRYSGQEDVIVGVPVDNRSRRELELLIGPFVNSIVLRGDMSGSPTFRELLGRTRRRLLDAIEHEELPFERLVERLAPDRHPNRHPLFQAQVMLNPPECGIRIVGLDTEELETTKTSSRVDLTLLLQQQQADLDAVWEYSSDLFGAETIDAMAGHFLRLLRSIVARPDRPIDELELLEATERSDLLARFGDQGTEFETGCLHELFEAQAARAPDAVAVLHERQSLSYGELNANANRLAHQLRGLGVGQETLVAVCLERSLNLVVAILAVLKTGGAYVPLDPDDPADRLAFILSDCSARVVISQESLLDRLAHHGAEVVCVDRDSPGWERLSVENPQRLAGPESLA